MSVQQTYLLEEINENLKKLVNHLITSKSSIVHDPYFPPEPPKRRAVIYEVKGKKHYHYF